MYSTEWDKAFQKEYCLSIVIKFQLLTGGRSYGQEKLRELGEKREARDQRLSLILVKTWSKFWGSSFLPLLLKKERLRPILIDLFYLGLFYLENFQENSHTISSGNMLPNFMRWCIYLLIQRKKEICDFVQNVTDMKGN